MKILKHAILALSILNLPTFGLINFGSGVGAAFALMSFVTLFFYYFASEKHKIIIPLILLGLLYFSISGINFHGPLSFFLKDCIKYFLFILAVNEVARDTKSKELLLYLFIGAMSVTINSLIFSDSYGRYGGLYINPNRAGLVCILGFVFSYKLTNKNHKVIAQLLFTLSGLATLSRYFILLLILINVLSLFANRKNIVGLFAGAIGFVIILNTPAFKLNQNRFGALQSIFSTQEVDTEVITEESRNETWALYTDVLMQNALIGTGTGAMQGANSYKVKIGVGVHNTYLMVLGEAGIIPFLLIVIFYVSLLARSFKSFKQRPEYFYLAIVLSTFLLVSHMYFSNYVILFFTIWLYTRISRTESQNKIETY